MRVWWKSKGGRGGGHAKKVWGPLVYRIFPLSFTPVATAATTTSYNHNYHNPCHQYNHYYNHHNHHNCYNHHHQNHHTNNDVWKIKIFFHLLICFNTFLIFVWNFFFLLRRKCICLTPFVFCLACAFAYVISFSIFWVFGSLFVLFLAFTSNKKHHKCFRSFVSWVRFSSLLECLFFVLLCIHIHWTHITYF